LKIEIKKSNFVRIETLTIKKMTNSYLKQFEFENWSNTLILKTLESIPKKEERAQLLFSHLLSSHAMWLCRVTKTEIKDTLFQERTLAECEQLMGENRRGWSNFLENKSQADLQEKIEFLSAWESNPSKRSITLEDALIHLINHSSYHRGQIVASLKGIIPELPLTTYIMYASEIL